MSDKRRVALTSIATLVVAVLLAAAPARAGSGPPVIREPFTPLPCPAHPRTTLALEGCAEKALLGTDRLLDARVRAVYRLLASSGRGPFVQGEAWWLRYRRASCLAEASRYAGGTIQPVAFASCEVARNQSHLRDLAALERALRGP